jgi:uncharacterized BrkB/YihY/UPF0761 family membrane protein
MSILNDLNTESFLKKAFDVKENSGLIRSALFRRNLYLALFLTGIACVFIAAFMDRGLLSVLSLGLATLSLVVMTKYNTQVYFLRAIKLRKELGEDKNPLD